MADIAKAVVPVAKKRGGRKRSRAAARKEVRAFTSASCVERHNNDVEGYGQKEISETEEVSDGSDNCVDSEAAVGCWDPENERITGLERSVAALPVSGIHSPQLGREEKNDSHRKGAQYDADKISGADSKNKSSRPIVHSGTGTRECKNGFHSPKHYLQKKNDAAGENPIKLIGSSYVRELEKCTVYISNLVRTVEEADIRKTFTAECGVVDIRLIRNYQGKLKGFAYVDFASGDLAKTFLQTHENISFHGRKVRVAMAECNRELYEETTVFVSNLPRTQWNGLKQAKLISGRTIGASDSARQKTRSSICSYAQKHMDEVSERTQKKRVSLFSGALGNTRIDEHRYSADSRVKTATNKTLEVSVASTSESAQKACKEKVEHYYSGDLKTCSANCLDSDSHNEMQQLSNVADPVALAVETAVMDAGLSGLQNVFVARDGEGVCRGYGYLHFVDQEACVACLQCRQTLMVEDNALLLRPSIPMKSHVRVLAKSKRVAGQQGLLCGGATKDFDSALLATEYSLGGCLQTGEEVDVHRSDSGVFAGSKVTKSGFSACESVSAVGDVIENVLFVRNLSFLTNKRSLAKHFRRAVKDGEGCEVELAKVCRDDGGRSKGYGFVKIRASCNISQYLKLDRTELDGREIRVERSTRPIT